MADPQAVNAWQGGDAVNVACPFRGFDEADHGGAVIGGLQCCGHRCSTVIVMRHLQPHAALACREVLHRIHHGLRLRDGGDHRGDQPFRAHVAGPCQHVILQCGHAHDHGNARRLEVADGAFQRLEAEA